MDFAERITNANARDADPIQASLDLLLDLINPRTYTPTVEGLLNVDSVSADVCFWSKGHVSGRVDINPTSSGVRTKIYMTLPYSVNLVTGSDASGICCDYITGATGGIYADANSDRVVFDFKSGDNVNADVRFSFRFKV